MTLSEIPVDFAAIRIDPYALIEMTASAGSDGTESCLRRPCQSERRTNREATLMLGRQKPGSATVLGDGLAHDHSCRGDGRQMPSRPDS